VSKREETITAMLDAAEALFSERGFTAVSVRDIAQQVGVSHALVHRYLGSKEDIYRAVLKRNEDVIYAAGADDPDLLSATSRMLREGLAHHRQYLRLVAHSALHGVPFERSIVRFAATERLAELAEAQAAVSGHSRDQLDPRFVIAAAVALYLGWIATEPWVLPAAGLPDMDEEAIVDGLERVILGILARNIPGVGAGEPPSPTG
jgi:AcrR family transcriptional regulator